MNADDFVGGHSILALERFMDETRHMIIFDVLPLRLGRQQSLYLI